MQAGSMRALAGDFKSQKLRRSPHLSPSADGDDSFDGSVSRRSPGGTLDGRIVIGGGAVFHPANGEEMSSGVPSNINVVSDPPVSVSITNTRVGGELCCCSS